MDDVVKDGDLVLLLDGAREHLIRAGDRMAALGGGAGALNAKRLIGMSYGELIGLGSRELIVLRPDIRDVLGNLERGPQIIIPKDIGSIVTELGLTSGMTVVEGGAGSGSLTLALLNAVGPSGRVVTYELREDHLEKAKRNVSMSPYRDRWEGRLGDIAGCDIKGADAFVVDVPDPQDAVAAASGSLRVGGRFCSYIPTVNQLEKISEKLMGSGFIRVRALEVLSRDYSLRKGALRPQTEMLGHTGFMVHARWVGRSQSSLDQ
jgi:tRNA (adenine57-N1/adenine58-N1)-methyltransferase